MGKEGHCKYAFSRAQKLRFKIELHNYDDYNYKYAEMWNCRHSKQVEGKNLNAQ